MTNLKQPEVGMQVRAHGPYWFGSRAQWPGVERGNMPRAVIEEVRDGIVIIDWSERPGASRRWDLQMFWSMWEEVPNRFERDLGI